MKIVFNVNGKKVPIKSLQYISKANQLEVMRNWFYENFEDPVHSCPYNGREGGYAYIHGGPYDASEELQAMFGEYVKFDYIEELANDLNFECTDWSGNSNNIDDWYDEDIYDAVTSSDNPFAKFIETTDNIKTLSQTNNKGEQREHLLGILYTNVITALETLYVELFIQSVDKDDTYVASCIEKANTEFKVSKDIAALPFKAASIEQIREELLKAIKENLIAINWHSPDKVIKRYKSTFGIKVHADWPISEIEIATQNRNHLVHRGGKDKEGNPVVITDADLEKLLDDAFILAGELHDSLQTALDAKEQEKHKAIAEELEF
ncbi:hypothetical protein [Aeromonas veronii]|uniref:hypothetical protein n=1 Tax=Aeromonas veronii TaxID=654 RepID=UPI00366BC1C5